LPAPNCLERLDVSVEVLRLARQRRVELVLTSDAHHESELGRIQFAALNAQRAGVAPEQVVNTWPASRLLDWATKRA
jgi:histidinol phosphatase-like PHP family hydrolase